MLIPRPPRPYTTPNPTTTEVLDYLHAFARDAGLLPFIHCNSTVTHVALLPPSSSSLEPHPSFRLTIHSPASAAPLHTVDVDHLVAANGHYSVPRMPSPPIPGLFPHFSGVLLHSSAYRSPTPFRGSKVLVVGAGFSGVDIASAIAQHADRCWISAKNAQDACPDSDSLQTSPIPLPLLLRVSKKSLHFTDGTKLPHPDFILLATGFQYAFPFFPPDFLRVRDNLVTPLYGQLFHAAHPSLVLPGVPFKIIPFLIFHHQAAWASRVWRGDAPLPPLHVRTAQAEAFERTAAEERPKHQAHMLGDRQFEYIEAMCRESTEEPPVKLKELWFNRRF